MKLIRSLTLALILALSVCILPASAAKDSGITITTVEPAAGGPGIFTWEGIYDNGEIICAGGTVESYTFISPKPSTTILENDVFTCNDGSGTFTVTVKIPTKPNRTANWTVTGGTGYFSTVSGGGSASISTDPSPSGAKVKTFSGNLHLR